MKNCKECIYSKVVHPKNPECVPEAVCTLSDEVGFVSYICSECGAEIEVEDCSDDKFCFNCGAIMREDDNEHTDPIIKAIQENNTKYDERPSIDFSKISCDLGESTEAKRKSDNLPSCNSCLHNGTWDCIKCKGFDKYEKRGST